MFRVTSRLCRPARSFVVFNSSTSKCCNKAQQTQLGSDHRAFSSIRGSISPKAVVFQSTTQIFSNFSMSADTGKGYMSIEQVAAMRLNYGETKFDEQDLPSLEPIAVFDSWFKEAANTDGIQEANAMTLATCSSDGRPSARVVLLKGYDKSGFRFFTNYESRKGKELDKNPFVALVFYWEPLHKQVRIEGPVERLPVEESDKYFHSRPRTSQIGALVSNQSSVIKGREDLAKRESELKEKYKDNDIPIPMPDYWGGYVVKPEYIEFWSGKTSRLHDRIVFLRPKECGVTPDGELTKQGKDGWVYQRLSP